MKSRITVTVSVKAPLERVWACWTDPAHITHWNFASDDWACPRATNDLQVGGRFNWRMEAKDGSVGFDFEGTYTMVEPERRITYTMAGEDARKVEIEFTAQGDSCSIRETFDPESENPLEMQQAGWQAILNKFKHYTESERHSVATR